MKNLSCKLYNYRDFYNNSGDLINSLVSCLHEHRSAFNRLKNYQTFQPWKMGLNKIWIVLLIEVILLLLLKCILQNYIILQNVKVSGCCWSQGKWCILIYTNVKGHQRMILFLKVHSRHLMEREKNSCICKSNSAEFVDLWPRTPNCERFNSFKHSSSCYYCFAFKL